MTAFVALLRSVNVAGHGRLAMAELKEMFMALGYTDVATYIQTGNVIFQTPSRDATKIETAIERELGRTFGAAPKVLLRTIPELLKTETTSPYPKLGADPSRHHVTFLSEAPSKERLAAFST